MQNLHPAFLASLRAARDTGIAPVYFFWVRARNRQSRAIETMGLWSGDEDHAFSVQTPEGTLETRTYLGRVNLSVANLKHVADFTDQPVTVGMSQIAPAAQQLARGLDVRMAYCEIHATSWAGGILSSPPQLLWVGIVDETLIATPEIGGEGNIGYSIRDELMTQLTSPNPAKSSDAHQKRRQAGDRFSEYSGAIASRNIQWWKD